MSRILHVLNGDATLTGFKQTGLSGDIVVWREVLSEGPLAENISSAAFWTQRKEWISQNFNVQTESYALDVIDEVAKLNDEYDEINLWFEFDLHCQVNLLGVLMLLKQQVDLSQPRLYLISPNDYTEVTNFRGMGQLNGEQLEDLYDSRLSITPIDFYAAGKSWKLLVNSNTDELLEWANTNTYWGNLHWLCDALKTHVKRVTQNQNGLNSVEQALLDIYQTGIDKKHELYEQFWTRHPIYGMGDKELDLYLAGIQKRYPINIS